MVVRIRLLKSKAERGRTVISAAVLFQRINLECFSGLKHQGSEEGPRAAGLFQYISNCASTALCCCCSLVPFSCATEKEEWQMEKPVFQVFRVFQILMETSGAKRKGKREKQPLSFSWCITCWIDCRWPHTTDPSIHLLALYTPATAAANVVYNRLQSIGPGVAAPRLAFSSIQYKISSYYFGLLFTFLLSWQNHLQRSCRRQLLQLSLTRGNLTSYCG